MPLTLLQTINTPKYKGIEANTVNLEVTGRLRPINGINFLKHIENRSETWI